MSMLFLVKSWESKRRYFLFDRLLAFIFAESVIIIVIVAVNPRERIICDSLTILSSDVTQYYCVG